MISFWVLPRRVTVTVAVGSSKPKRDSCSAVKWEKAAQTDEGDNLSVGLQDFVARFKCFDDRFWIFGIGLRTVVCVFNPNIVSRGSLLEQLECWSRLHFPRQVFQCRQKPLEAR